MPRPDIWHRRFYVHPIQRKYRCCSPAPLIIGSVAISPSPSFPDDLDETLRPYTL